MTTFFKNLIAIMLIVSTLSANVLNETASVAEVIEASRNSNSVIVINKKTKKSIKITFNVDVYGFYALPFGGDSSYYHIRARGRHYIKTSNCKPKKLKKEIGQYLAWLNK